MEKSLISCIVHFVTLVLSFFIQEKKKGKELYPIIKKWNNNIEKTCGCKSCFACKKIEKEVDSPMTIVLEKQLSKKKLNVFSFELPEFFGVKVPFKKDVVLQK